MLNLITFVLELKKIFKKFLIRQGTRDRNKRKLTLRYYHMVDFRGKTRYQRGHSVHVSGFKLATSMFVLSILDI